MRGLLIGIFSVSFLMPGVLSAAADSVLRPVDLRCEYRVDPMGIDTAEPRLSWKLEAASPDARGLEQSAYRILVASSQAILARNQGDLWDSGKVDTDTSIQIPYRGKRLSSGQEVWWKVQVWDIAAKLSAWSAPARWSMGLLAAGDWKAKWIGLDSGAGTPKELSGAQWIGADDPGAGKVYFRTTFDVSSDNPVSDALLFLAGSGATSARLNGDEALHSDGIKDPISTDITGGIHPGTNLLAVSVAAAGSEPAALIGAIELDLADGSRVMLHTGNDWRVSTTEAAGWDKVGTDDPAWPAAKLLGAYGTAPWGEVTWETGYEQNHWPASFGNAPWGTVGYGWRTVLPARMLRKDFTAPTAVKRATLYVSGLGLFEAYLNGEKVGRDVLSPALSEYDKRVFYLTYDVTKLLRPGANAIGVILGNGRFFAPRYNIPTAMRSFGYPKLLLQLEIEKADGTIERVCSDDTWKLTTDGPIRANNEYDGETYDARKEMVGWSRPGFGATGWQQAQVVDGPPGILSAQPIDPIRVTETLKPVAVHEVRPGVFVYDMGQNMVGWCRLVVSGPRGTTVTLRHAERLRPNGMIYTDNLRSAEVTDTYILTGIGTEVYEPRFTYHGFRYVEVKGFPGKPRLTSLEGREVHDDLDHVSEFATSNPLLNQIYKAVLWGARDNYRSVPTDCPQRDERQGWLGDRSGESLGETYMSNVAAFYAKWVQDMRDAQDEQGRISDVSPAYWPFYWDNVTWPASFIMVADHVYQQYGDRRVIEQNYPAMRKWVQHMQTYLKDDLMPRDTYGDWCVPPESPELIHSQDPSRKTEGGVLGTTYFYRLLRIMQNNATLLGKTADAAEYSELAGRMMTAFNNKYYHAETSQYSNGSATSSVLPLAFGMVPDEDRQGVVDALIHKISVENHNHVSTGLVGGQWLMQTLSDCGHADVAYQMAGQHDYPSWGYMVDHGATTIWELWNGDTANPAMNSGNHLMLVGDLVTWFYQNLAGIRPDPARPAFKHILLRPTPVGDLTSVSASFDSSYGKIVSQWKIAGGEFVWNFTVPANSSATVYVPEKDPEAVTESGKAAGSARGVTFLRTEAGTAVYEVGSGSYRFSASMR